MVYKNTEIEKGGSKGLEDIIFSFHRREVCFNGTRSILHVFGFAPVCI